ncbi:MAG: hypothetical protein ACJ8H8_17580 [Geminicoccaceae bacterium]
MQELDLFKCLWTCPDADLVEFGSTILAEDRRLDRGAHEAPFACRPPPSVKTDGQICGKTEAKRVAHDLQCARRVLLGKDQHDDQSR